METLSRHQVELSNGSHGFRALIAAEIRVLSEADGELEYIASDETTDSYKEIIRADGWKFDLFRKNSPFVDSHDYSSINKLLGIVVDWRVDKRNRRLIETVRWAKDVPGNTAAQVGWRMLAAGFGPKAVSVGFSPERVVHKWDTDRKPWNEQLTSLGLTEQSEVRAIYVSQQQIELSACILGANPNAVQAGQKALAAGVINKREFNLLRDGNTRPQFQIPFETRPTHKKNMSTRLKEIASKFEEPIQSRPVPRSPSPSAELIEPQSSALAFRGGDGALPLRTLCELHLSLHPEQRQWLRAAALVLCRAPRALWGDAEMEFSKRALTTGDSGLGQGISVYEPLSTSLLSFMLKFSAFRTLGVVPLETGKTKIASVTGRANGYWYKPLLQGTNITATASIAGKSISPECSTLGALLEVSAESLGDGKTTFEGALLTALVEGLGYRIDYTCFQADGTDDDTNGGMTGIFADNAISVVTAGDGGANAASLSSDDFSNLIGAVDSSALANPCMFWISPSFLPSLLKIRDAGQRLLNPPTEQGALWTILGFPVTWAAGAPGTDGASKKVAAFGRQDAYTVALRQDFEVAASAATAKWVQNIWMFRGIARARCLTRDAASLAVLKTSAL